MALRRLLGLTVTALLVAACGDDTSTSAGSGGSGGGGATASSDAAIDASSGAVTGTGGDASGGAGGGEAVDPSTLPDGGYVTLMQTAPDEYSVSAAFLVGRGDGGCEVMTEGACSSSRCPTKGSGSSTARSAGTLTVEVSGTSIAVPRDERGHYALDADGDLFGDSPTIEVTATGEDVPPFDVTLQSPPRIEDLSPAPDEPIVATAEDLELTWSLASGSGVVSVTFLRTDDTEDAWVECAFDAEDGAGIVPGALLVENADLPAFVAYVTQTNRVDRAVGSHGVSFVTGSLAAFVPFNDELDGN